MLWYPIAAASGGAPRSGGQLRTRVRSASVSRPAHPLDRLPDAVIVRSLVHIAELLDAGVTETGHLERVSGLLFAAPFFSATVATPVWGFLGDRHGRRHEGLADMVHEPAGDAHRG